MKKGILVLIAVIGFGSFANAQTISDKDVKDARIEINQGIEQLEQAVAKADWKKIQKAVDKTVVDLNKNADQVVDLVQQIDLSRLIKTMKKVAIEIEQIDTKELQRTVEEMGVKIDEAFSQKKTHQ